jgi:hypothetical protein
VPCWCDPYFHSRCLDQDKDLRHSCAGLLRDAGISDEDIAVNGGVFRREEALPSDPMFSQVHVVFIDDPESASDATDTTERQP